MVDGSAGQTRSGSAHLLDRLPTSRRGAATLRDEAVKSAKSVQVSFAARNRPHEAPIQGSQKSARDIRHAWRQAIARLVAEGPVAVGEASKAQSNRGLTSAAQAVTGAVLQDAASRGAPSTVRPLTRHDYTGRPTGAPCHDSVSVPKQQVAGPTRASQSWPDQGSARKNPILRSPTRAGAVPGSTLAREISSARYHNLAYEGIRREYMAQSVKVQHWATSVSIGPGASHFVARGDYQSGAGRLVYRRSEATVSPTRAGKGRGSSGQ